jgi:hypothetical protein
MADNDRVRYPCPSCPANFASLSSRNRHMSRLHGGMQPVYECPLCGLVFTVIHEMHDHILTHADNGDYIVVVNLMNNACVTYRKMYIPPIASLDLTTGADHGSLSQILAQEAALKFYVKCNIVVTAEFIKLDDRNVVTDVINVHLRCKSFVVTRYQNYLAHIEKAHAEIQTNLDDFMRNSSSWLLSAIYKTELNVAKCKPLTGSCGGDVAASLEIISLRCIDKLKVSADGGDNRCFFRAVAAYFMPAMSALTCRELDTFVLAHFRTDTINVPVQVDRIPTFEKLNAHLNFKINVLYVEDGDVYPIFASPHIECEHHINILLYKTCVGGKAVNHYSHIGNLSKLLRKTYMYYAKTNAKLCRAYEHIDVCPNCLAKFSERTVMSEHYELCKQNKCQRVKVPTAEDITVFKNHMRKFRIPIVGFFDFESVMLKPAAACLICPDMDKCYHRTLVDAVQEACTYSLIIVDWRGDIVHSSTYSGHDCSDQFVEELLDIEPHLQEMLEAYQPMHLTPAQEHAFQQATQCHICETPFLERDLRHRDHCHLTGNFMGAAHALCNMQRSVVKKIPLFCHNFTGQVFAD